MQVIITKDQLAANSACPAYLTSPEWSTEQEALVYVDWDATVARLAQTQAGIDYLGWLVRCSLVPMTRSQFAATRRAARERTRSTRASAETENS
jgi:hypothetical protein